MSKASKGRAKSLGTTSPPMPTLDDYKDVCEEFAESLSDSAEEGDISLFCVRPVHKGGKRVIQMTSISFLSLPLDKKARQQIMKVLANPDRWGEWEL